MDIKKRQEAPADLKEQAIKTRLKKRAENKSKYIWSKRNTTNPLKGYNLSLCKRSTKIKFKRCRECGSTTHLKANCSILIKNQLMVHFHIKNRKRRELKRKKTAEEEREKASTKNPAQWT